MGRLKNALPLRLRVTSTNKHLLKIKTYNIFGMQNWGVLGNVILRDVTPSHLDYELHRRRGKSTKLGKTTIF